MNLRKNLKKKFKGYQQLHFIHDLFSFFVYLRSKSAGYKAFQEKNELKFHIFIKISFLKFLKRNCLFQHISPVYGNVSKMEETIFN